MNKEDINEKDIIASFLPDEDINISRVPLEPIQNNVQRKKVKGQDYENIFIRASSVNARAGKTVYIRKEFHDTIMQIINVIGENEVTLSGYIDNVLSNHFDTYYKEIMELYEKNHKGISIPLIHKDNK